MRNFVISTLLLLSVFTVMSAQSVRNVFGFPATEPGYSLGVSACYAGQIGDYIVMAGGCNFPTPGNKTYYAGIYAAPLDNAVLRWQLVGFLPEPAPRGQVFILLRISNRRPLSRRNISKYAPT